MQLDHHDTDPHHPGKSSATTAVNDDKTANGLTATKDLKSAIRDYFQVLERYDATPSILKRPLPEPDAADEPQAKRKKSEEPQGPAQVSIADKVARGDYKDLDAVIFDVKSSASSQVIELRTIEPGKDPSSNDEAIARTLSFKQKAHEIFRREIAYPNVPEALQSLDSTNALQTSASGNVVLSVHGMAPRPTQLYSSLQHPVSTPGNPKGTIRALSEKLLPQGVRTAKAMPFFFPSAVEKDKKSKTLGELFPPPRNLPSLQPPKAPKSTTKGVQVGWHRPELTEKSKYRAGSYSTQPLSTGRWLDYSNAAPPSQIMTKQRERALSLAGTKPSTSDLEASEMESLFRGAFSSFAPSRDDSAATISSGMISQTLWWQKAGKRSFERLIGTDHSEDSANDSDMADASPAGEIDEGLIQDVIDNWDDTMVDPSLEQACCPKKSDEEKDVDDVLQDVSDMIQTLISYQRNRNLQLPTASSQSRYAADPAHSDMLTNGTPVQPSEEETATYEALKTQLVLVIQMLPPFAVARLNSDRLDELNISTKMEVRTDDLARMGEHQRKVVRLISSIQVILILLVILLNRVIRRIHQTLRYHRTPITISRINRNTNTNTNTSININNQELLRMRLMASILMHMSQQGYNPTATPTRQPSYGGQPNMANDPSRRFYPPASSPTVQQHQQHQQPQQPQPQPQPQQSAQNRSHPNSTPFQTSLNSHQLQRAMDQARQRFEQKTGQRIDEATKNSMSGPGQSHPQVTTPVGLGGIGLGPDPARMAAARAGAPGTPSAAVAGGYNASSQSPKPQVNLPAASNPPAATNGSPMVTTSGPAANGATPTAGKEA
ncbi:hypothetical protein UCREL1_3088 [Eutypa lata UCREL1]|uniref:Uncharacterized protein n=1 Tax=Eutypa lata (strain UCR-EL1) TaxID=1287681 RepID=M7STM5_EUTLA|nr:hypothetical protein UCREL1_3088 [Eutypa lata UCREL1]